MAPCPRYLGQGCMRCSFGPAQSPACLLLVVMCALIPAPCLPLISWSHHQNTGPRLAPFGNSCHSRSLTAMAFCGPMHGYGTDQQAQEYRQGSGWMDGFCAANRVASCPARARVGFTPSKTGYSSCHRRGERRMGGLDLAMQTDKVSGRDKKSSRVGARRSIRERPKPAVDPNDPQEAMKRWTRMLEAGQKGVDDIKMKTMQALDNLFSGGFMQESTEANDMLPVLRKYMMNDFEGYSPPKAQIPTSLLDDFENFGAPEALTAPSLTDGVRLSDGDETGQRVSGVDFGMDRLQSLDREQFSKAVQSGLSALSTEDINLVFDDIDKDGDGTLTLEELYETYKTVQAEVVTDQDMELRMFDELEAAKLLPETPDAAVANVLPASGRDKWGGYGDMASASGAQEDLSTRMQEWEEVCEVLTRQSAYLPDDGRDMLSCAVELSGQLLLADSSVADGSSDFGDGLALGGIVAGLQSQSEAVTAAVLLPAFRRGAVNAAQVRERFGPVVASIVEDSLWLSKLPDRTGLLDDDGSRFLREYMVAVSRDHRAVVVMLADRLHSLRRASAAPLYEQHLRALEALQVYSPLAHALGVGKWLWELEDLSFRALFPDSYSDVERWQLELWEESEEMMEMAKSEVLASLNDNALLVEHVQRYTISSRRKSIFSTFKKMYQKNKNLEGIKDVFAMRIVIGLHASARDNADLQARVCLEAYVALRKALPEYTEGRGRFKDYVTKPKPNGYQSVHTTLKTPTGLPIEIQIRTEEMHAAAEFGDAAHNLYKGGIKSLSSAQKFADSVRKDNVAALGAEESCASLRSPAASVRGGGLAVAGAGIDAGGGEDLEHGLGPAGEVLRLELAKEGLAREDTLFTADTVIETTDSLQETYQTVTGDLETKSSDFEEEGKDTKRRSRKRPPSLQSVVRRKGAARKKNGTGRLGQRSVQRVPTIMTAPSIAAEEEQDSLDSWLGQSIGEDIIAEPQPRDLEAASVVSSRRVSAVETSSVSKMVVLKGSGNKAMERPGIQARTPLLMVLDQMEQQAWRDAAFDARPLPANPAEEALVRDLTRQQGAELIERAERLRMLLDSSLTQLFDVQAAANAVAERFELPKSELGDGIEFTSDSIDSFSRSQDASFVDSEEIAEAVPSESIS